MISRLKPLFTGATIAAVSIHFVEDIMLLSIGRYLPVPWWAMYVIGVGFSWVMLALIINRIESKIGHVH